MKTVFCPYCGHKMEIGDQVISFYCMKCGEAIESGKVGNDKSFTYNKNIHSTKTDEARIIEAQLKHERFLYQKQEDKKERVRLLIFGTLGVLFLLALPEIGFTLIPKIFEIFK